MEDIEQLAKEAKEKGIHVGKNLGRIRKFNELPLKEVAEVLGMSPNTLSDMEKMEVFTESVPVKKLAEFYKVPVKRLFQDLSEFMATADERVPVDFRGLTITNSQSLIVANARDTHYTTSLTKEDLKFVLGLQELLAQEREEKVENRKLLLSATEDKEYFKEELDKKQNELDKKQEELDAALKELEKYKKTEEEK